MYEEYSSKESIELQAIYHVCDAIKKRLLSSSEIATALVNSDKKLKEILEQRNSYLYMNPDVSIINLSTLSYNKKLLDGFIQLRLNGNIVVKVKVHELVWLKYKDTTIEEPELLSVNKENNGPQILQFATEGEIWLHRAIKLFKEVKAIYKYQIGHVINIHPFVGIYKITNIDDKLNVTITCKKWTREGRQPVKIKYSDIKGFADTKLYTSNFLKNRKP
jgi:hypothetical protein